MNGSVTFALAGMALLSLAGCGNQHEPKKIDVQIAEETLYTANEERFDYLRQYQLACDGNENAIRKLYLFSHRVDAAAAIGHGVALVDLLERIGEITPARAAQSLNREDQQLLTVMLEAGVAYRYQVEPEEFRQRYPRVFTALNVR